jgi:hypothetical protein
MKKVSDPPDDPYAMALRLRSGNVTTCDPLVCFLYILMRDHLSQGAVEYIMLQLEAEDNRFSRRRTPLTNGWLAAYAKDIVKRLQGKNKVKRKSPVRKAVKPIAAPEIIDMRDVHRRKGTSK